MRRGDDRWWRTSPAQGRGAIAGFATMVAILSAHALLETARDALFLTHIRASRLPLAYIAIALLALLVSRANQALAARLPRRALLSGSLWGGSIITALFWRITMSEARLCFAALYVWTGLLATVLIVQLWLQLGDAVERKWARGVFSIVGAGGLFGAALGSLLATFLLSIVRDPRVLILAAAAILACAAALPFALPTQLAEPERELTVPRNSLAQLRDGYLARLFGAALLGAMIVTGCDFLFKSTVVATARSNGWELGPLFARFYALVNGVSLVVQLWLVPRLLRDRVDRALMILPALLLLGAAGFSLTLWLAPALMLKAADGTLRHSVHRTAVELTYLPLSRSARERMQMTSDTIGQRGGQALASLMILGTAALPLPRLLPVLLTALAAAWLLTIASLRSRLSSPKPGQ